MDWRKKPDLISYALKTLGKGDPGFGFGHRVSSSRREELSNHWL